MRVVHVQNPVLIMKNSMAAPVAMPTGMTLVTHSFHTGTNPFRAAIVADAIYPYMCVWVWYTAPYSLMQQNTTTANPIKDDAQSHIMLRIQQVLCSAGAVLCCAA